MAGRNEKEALFLIGEVPAIDALPIFVEIFLSRRVWVKSTFCTKIVRIASLALGRTWRTMSTILLEILVRTINLALELY